MGAFSSRPTIRIEGEEGWEEGEYIIIKGVMTAGDMESIAKQQITQGKDGKAATSVSTSQVAMLAAMIEDWMLLGDNNTPVPLYEGVGKQKRKRMEVIAKLPLEYAVPVLDAIDKLNQKEAVTNTEDFSDSANEPSQTN